jgi:malate dehydrogenase (oxaloacetate-decarboxylating)(NADP+)
VLAAMESGVALNPIMDWDKYEELLDRLGNDNKMVRLITNRAKIDPKKIVFAEADHLDVKGSPDCFRRRYQPAHFIG